MPIPLAALMRHALLLGSSGSGKTVLAKVIAEECLRKRLPVIAIDTQGDLASMALAATGEGADAAQFRDLVDVKIWTPGSTRGIPFSLAPDMTIPASVRPELRGRTAETIARDLAALINDRSDVTVAALTIVMTWAAEEGRRFRDVSHLAQTLVAPPPSLAVRLSPLFETRELRRLAKAFTVRTIGAAGELLSTGRAIDIDEMLGLYVGGPMDHGKARLSIVSLVELATDDERQTVIAALCSAIYRWMLTLTSEGPWAGLLIDEVMSLLPPVRKPAAKAPLERLLREGRKFGLGCILATQSPGDLDFSCMAQISTVAVGRITTLQEARKLAPLLAPHDCGPDLLARLPLKRPGEFTLVSGALDQPIELQVRHPFTDHRRVSPAEVANLVRDHDRQELGGVRPPTLLSAKSA